MDRRSRAFLASLIAASFAALSAIVACSSVPDLHFAEDDGGRTEGGLDAPRDVDPNCKKTGPEVCDDGIDNDCNGDVDCQDSACTAKFSCQDAPAGWTAVGFAAATRPGCPVGTDGIDLNAVSGDGAAACSCSCTSAGSACNGNLIFTRTAENTCLVGAATTSIPVNGGCTALGAPVNIPAGAFTKAAGVGPSACNPTAVINGGAPTNGRLCLPPRFGSGCAANQVCAPKAPTGLASCVTQTGASSCPTGFTNRSTAGASAADNRTCTGCQCGSPTACSGGSVSLYDNGMCKANGAFRGAEGITPACAVPGDSGFTATHFKSTGATGGCGNPTAQATPGGSLAWTDQRTVCCK